MPRGKKELAEQIIPKLREVEVEVGRGKTVLEAVKKIGVTEQTYYRWKKKFGGLRIDQAKRLLADAELDMSSLSLGVLGDLRAVLGNDPTLEKLWADLTAVAPSVLRFSGAVAGAGPTVSLDGAFTVEAWAHLEAPIGNEDGLLAGDGLIDMNFHDGSFRVWTKGHADIAVAKSKTTPDQWRHYAVPRDAEGTFRISIDGELDAESRARETVSYPELRIGWSTPRRGGTRGRLAEFRVWNTARTAEEIRADFDRIYVGDDRRPDSLVSSYGGSDWGELLGGARVEPAIDAPMLVTAADTEKRTEKFALYRQLAGAGGDPAKGWNLFTPARDVAQAGFTAISIMKRVGGLSRRSEHLEPVAAAEPRGRGPGGELIEGPAAGVAEVERPVVDVELDVLHEHAIVKLLGMLSHRRQGRVAIGQGDCERVADHALHRCDHLGPESAGGHDAAQWQRTAGLGLPAAAEILRERKTARLPGEPALVDADTEVGRAGRKPGHDPGKHDLLDAGRVRMEERKQERRRRLLARTEGELGRIGRPAVATGREQERADAEAEGRAARQHDHVGRQPEGRGEAQFADVELAAAHPLVERLDVEQLDLEVEPSPRHSSREQAVEGEGVVGAGGDAQADRAAHRRASSGAARIVAAKSAAAASAGSICQRALSRSPAVLEMPRTISSGTPASRQASATP
jgi:hypothetical protein